MSTRGPDDARAPLTLGLVSAFVLVIGAAVWASVVPVSGAVTAMGEVDALPHRHEIQHAEGGQVAAVMVREGQAVEAGQLLLRLDGGLLDQEWRLNTTQLAEVMARSVRLSAERDGGSWPEATALESVVTMPERSERPERDRATDREEALQHALATQRRLFDARAQTLVHHAAQLEQRRIQAEAELAGLAAQEAALATEGDLLSNALERHRALLVRGLTPVDRVAVLEREAVQLSGRQAALAARRAQLHGQIAELAVQAETLRAARREEAETQLAEAALMQLELLSRRRILAERRARLELRAPVAGLVHDLTVPAPGVVLAPGETALQIVPQDAEAQIAIRLSPDDIDRVYPGQPAQLHFPAFPDLELPRDSARVRAVSAAGLSDDRSGNRFFRVTLDLTQTGKAALSNRRLLPGMAVQAYIATGSRTPIAYLLDPLRTHMRGAMREP